MCDVPQWLAEAPELVPRLTVASGLGSITRHLTPSENTFVIYPFGSENLLPERRNHRMARKRDGNRGGYQIKRDNRTGN